MSQSIETERHPNQMQRLILILLLPLFAGCLDTSPRPMTTESIRIVSNTLIQSASVTYPDGVTVNVPPNEYELFRELFRKLAPVESTHEGPGLPALYDYQLELSAAGNVANIDVLIHDDGSLSFSLDEFHYDGGDADGFVAAADAIRLRLPQAEVGE